MLLSIVNKTSWFATYLIQVIPYVFDPALLGLIHFRHLMTITNEYLL